MSNVFIKQQIQLIFWRWNVVALHAYNLKQHLTLKYVLKQDMESNIDVIEGLEKQDSKSGSGTWLKWKDLWVTVADDGNSRVGKEPLAILKGLTGYAEPGEVLVVMGPSGCGKSVLLDALAGASSIIILL